MTVVVGGVRVVMGVEAEKTRISSGTPVLVVVSVGIGGSTGFFESLVLHWTCADDEELEVTVNVKAKMARANTNSRSNRAHILKLQ